MRGLWGALLGAVALGSATAYYHQNLPPDQVNETLWGLIFLQAVPSGAALGLATEIALRVPFGRRRALCCFMGALLALVPLGIWGWLAVSGDPFHALPKLWATLVLCMPTLGATTVMNLWGVFNLRPGRFRAKENESD